METRHPDIHTYYNNTRFDYRSLWNRRRRDVAVHFGYYDEHASRHAEALDNLNRVMADLAVIQPGEQVLDAGCGLGNACFWLSEHRQAHTTGISIVARQIADCQKAAAKFAGLPIARYPIEFLEADYCHTPFADATFDVVWACESVCHAAAKPEFYKEAFRLLKPGGRLVMAEYMRTGRPVSENGERLLAEWLRPWAIPDIDTAAEHWAGAAAAGFEKIIMQDVTRQVQVSLRNLHEMSVRWLPLGKWLNRVGLVNDVRLGNAMASVRQYEALQEGAWQYQLVLAWKRK